MPSRSSREGWYWHGTSFSSVTNPYGSLGSSSIRIIHGSVPKERRNCLGITKGIVRLSVGIGDVEDLRADMLQARRQLPVLGLTPDPFPTNAGQLLRWPSCHAQTEQ